MSRVVESLHEMKLYTVLVGEPVDRCARCFRDRFHDHRIVLTFRFRRQISGEQFGAVIDPFLTLEPGAGCGNEARGE